MLILRRFCLLSAILTLSFHSYSQLSGTYTINQGISSSSTNFTSFNDAVTALEQNGVNGAVTFEVVDTAGSYMERLDIGHINGTSSSNKVIFKNHSINADLATISDSGTYASYRVRFDSVSYLEFHGIRFDATRRGEMALYPYQLNSFLSFKDCEFLGNGSNSTAALVRTTYTPNIDEQHHFTFDSCLFKDYGLGILFRSYYWASGYNADYDHLVTDCEFVDCRTAIRTDITERIEISNNIVRTTDPNYSTFLNGFVLQGMISGQVFNNKIKITGKGPITGINTSYCGGQSSKPSRVYNNFVFVDNSDSTAECRALHDYETIRTLFVNNTFRHRSGSDKSVGVDVHIERRQNECAFVANIVSVEGKGLLFNLDSSSKVFSHFDQDRNCWYHRNRDSAFNYRDTLMTLNDFQQALGKDTLAVSVYPFFDTAGYHVAHYKLNGAGKKYTFSSRDIDGEPRNSSNDDIGADEFDPVARAAGIDSLSRSYLCSGTNQVDASLRNLGTDTLKSARILWEYRTSGTNWKTHKTVNWTGTIPPFERNEVTLGTFTTSFDSTYEFRLSVTLVNGVTDSLNLSGYNPYISDKIAPSLGGEYSVGKPNSDFLTLNDALDLLKEKGACDEVILLLEDTTFTGPLHLYRLDVLDANNRLIIRNKDTSNPAVILQKSWRDPDNITMHLHGVKHVTLDGLVFNPDSSNSRGRTILIDNNTEDLEIVNCRFEYILNRRHTFTIGSTDTAVLKDIRIEGCSFEDLSAKATGGPEHIIIFNRIKFRDPHHNIVIRNNHMDPFSGDVIRLSYANDVVFSGNSQVENTDIDNPKLSDYLLHFYNIRDLEFTKNRFQRSTSSLATFSSCIGVDSNIQISNNELVSLPSQRLSGRTLTMNGSNIDVRNNTIVHHTQHIDGIALNIGPDSSVNVTGNLVANYGGGFSTTLWLDKIDTCINNNFYSSGPRKHALRLKDTNSYIRYIRPESFPVPGNMEVDPILYAGFRQFPHNGALRNAITNGQAPIDDLLNELRDSTPDIGCYEFELLPANASLLSFSKEAYCAGNQDLSVKWRNDGGDTIRTIKLSTYLSRNDSAYTLLNSVRDTLALAPGMSTEQIVGNLTFAGGVKYRIKVEIDSVNGYKDGSEMRNSLISDSLKTAMSGEYSVGKPGDDFPSLYDAIDQLHSNGVCGPVRLLLRDTVYNRKIEIHRIKGSSPLNKLELTSHPANKHLPRIDFPSKLAYLWGGDPYEMIVLDGAQYVNLDSLYIRSGDMDTLQNSGWYKTVLIEIRGNSKSLSFTNDSIIDIAIPDQPLSRQDYRYHIQLNRSSNGDLLDRIVVDNCHFQNGAEPIQILSHLDYYMTDLMQVTNCTFKGQVKHISLSVADSVIFEHNVIDETRPLRGHHPSGVNINARYARVNANEIHLRSHDGYSSRLNRQGMLLSSQPSPYGKKTWMDITNNMVSITGDSTLATDRVIEMRLDSASVIHNSFHLDGGVTTKRILEFGGASDTSRVFMRNNSFSTKRKNPLFYFNTYAVTINSDYNNFNYKGLDLSYGNIRIREMKDWIQLYGDEHTVMVDPQYVNDSNLHTTSRVLNHGAIRLPGVTRDIDGDLRDTLRDPDIGADEFYLPANDARIVKTHHRGLCPDSQYIYVDLINDGDDSIRSVDLSYYIKRGSGSWQKLGTERWTGAIDLKDSFTMRVGKVLFRSDSLVKMRFTIDSVNQKTDTVDVNNIVTTDSFTTALPSVVEVGSSGKYSGLNEAVDALHFRGVCGPTRIEFLSGTYDEFDSIGVFPGIGAPNPVSFVSSPKNAGYAHLKTNWDSTGKDYLLLLKDVSYLNFDSLHFSGDAYINQAIFKMEGNTRRLRFDSDTLISLVQYRTRQRALIFDDFDDEDSTKYVTITNNYFEGPEVGVMFTNFDEFENMDSLVIRNNHFERLRSAIQCNGILGLVIEDNYFHVDSPYHPQSVSIWTNLTYGTLINRNEIIMKGPNQLVGMWIEHRNDNGPSDPVLITNNSVSILDSDRYRNSIGMIVSYLRDVTIAHNSVNIIDQDTGGIGIYLGMADRWPGKYKFYNNNIRANGAARAAYFWPDTSSSWQSDNNNYYSDRAKPIRWQYNLGGVSTLVALSGHDSNSLSVDPNYYEWYDLHTNRGELAKAGKALSPSIDIDIDGEARDTLEPCIGSDEFEYFDLQGDVLGTFPPTFCPGTSAIYTDLRNVGDDTITRVSLRYTLRTLESGRDVVKDTAHNVTIYPMDSVRLDLGTIQLSADSTYWVIVEIDLLNASAEFLKRHHRDTTFDFKTAMFGEFTIGASGSDFTSFKAAVNDLEQRGICDDVRFLVRSGTYNEQFSVGDVLGSSSERTIEFVSHPSNSNPARVKYAPGSTDPNYVVQVKDGIYITFDSLTFENTSDDFARVVMIRGKCDHLSFTHDSVIASGNLALTNQDYIFENADVAWTGHYTNNFTLSHSVLTGGIRSLYLGTTRTGNPKSSNMKILNNEFRDFYFQGIVLYQVDSLDFGHNLIHSIDSSQNERRAFWWSAGKHGAIHDNQMNIFARIPWGFHLSADSGTASDPIRVYNNMISVRNYASGVQNRHTGALGIDRLQHAHIEHNNIMAIAGKEWLHTIWIVDYYGSPSNLVLRNNILKAEKRSECLFTSLYANDFKSDYNAWYSDNVYAIWGKKSHSSLSSIQAMGTDSHSVSGDPNFYGRYDLHTRSKVIDGKGTPLSSYPKDIDGDRRNTSKPDIGADEMNRNFRDLEITRLIKDSISICTSTSEVLGIVVENKGTQDEDSFAVRLIIKGPKGDTSMLYVTKKLEYGFSDTLYANGIDLTKQGTYTLTAIIVMARDSFSSNDTLSTEWNTYNFNQISISDYEGCKNESYFVFLKAPKGHSAYRWYADATSTKVLSRDSVYQLVGLKQTDSFYVEIDKPLNYSVGAANTFIGTQNYSSDYTLGLRFDVLEHVIIDTVSVYPRSTGTLIVNIRDSASRLVWTGSFNITSTGLNQLPLNAFVEKGANYTIDLIGSSVSSVIRNTSGAQYAYTDANKKVRIKSDHNGNLNAYNFFYDWKVGKPSCISGRIKVRAILKDNPDNASVQADSVCSGERGYFIADNTGNNTYSWYKGEYDTKSFFNGDTLPVNNLTGPYSVWVQNDSSNGCSSRRTRSILYPIDLPNRPMSKDTFVCSEDSILIQLNADSSYHWYRSAQDTGKLFEGNTVTIEVQQFDTIWYAAVVRGCESNRGHFALDKRLLPSLPTISGRDQICDGDTIRLSSDSTILTWRDTSGTVLTTDTVLAVTNASPGIHEFEYSLDSNGCVNKSRRTVRIIPLPRAFSVEADSVCPDSSATINVNSGSTVHWYSSDTSLQAIHTGYTFQDTSGTAQTYYIALDSLGCMSSRYSVQAFMDSALIPELTLAIGDTACYGDSAYARATSPDGSVKWYKDQSGAQFLRSGSSYPITEVNSGGTYYVRAENAYCKSEMQYVDLLIHKLPHAGFSWELNGFNVDLSADTVKSNRTYNWITPKGARNGAYTAWDVHADGEYKVTLEVYDSITECTNSHTDSLTVTGLSVFDGHTQEEIQIYPVPNTGQFSVKHSGGSGNYVIYDAVGKRVDSGKLHQAGLTEISIEVSRGIYKISLNTEQGTTVIPFMVN